MQEALQLTERTGLSTTFTAVRFARKYLASPFIVIAELDPAIHDLLTGAEVVDGQIKSGREGTGGVASGAARRTARMVPRPQARAQSSSPLINEGLGGTGRLWCCVSLLPSNVRPALRKGDANDARIRRSGERRGRRVRRAIDDSNALRKTIRTHRGTGARSGGYRFLYLRYDRSRCQRARPSRDDACFRSNGQFA